MNMTNIKRYYIFLVLLVASIFSSCIEEQFPENGGVMEGESWVTINFAPEEADIIITKEAQSHSTENKIVNFHLFIFDKDGNKLYGKFFDNKTQVASQNAAESSTEDAWWASNPDSGINQGVVKFLAPNCSESSIYIFANLNSDAVRISADLLNANIQKESDLNEFEAYLNQETVNRISNFPMSGKMSNATINGGNINSEWEFKLTRLDAKIKFVFKTGERPDVNGQTISKFTPQQWKVINVPRTSFIIEGEQDSGDVPPTTLPSQYADYASKYFDTGFTNFEEFTSDTETGFTFYMLENRLTPKNTSFSSYNERSRQVKVNGGLFDGGNVSHEVTYVNSKGQDVTKEMKEFVNANDFSTYVVVTGRVDMNLVNDDAGQTLSGDVEYLIHLGDWSKTSTGSSWEDDQYTGITNYETKRNTSYTYTVTVNSVNNIRVEVETANTTNTENQPGATGEVTIAKEEIALCDCHYVTKTMTFHAKNFFKAGESIADELTWAVKTPFSDGMPKKTSTGEDNPEGLDYQWVHFRLNLKDSDGKFYEEQRRLYTTRVFETMEAQQENPDIDGTPGLAGYHNDGIMDIIALVKYIKEQVELYNHYRIYGGTNTSDFDNPDDFENAKICITAFVDEFYYEKHPLSGVASTDLWKDFVNQSDRYLHILCSSNSSKDGESRATGSVITIQQRSIRTIYNTAKDNYDLQSAWGLEQVDEYSNIWEWGTANTNGATDNYNGLRNSLRQWGLCGTNNNTFVNGTEWSDFMDFEVENSVPLLNAGHAYLRYSCMARNRDNNGNGVIDRDEIKWYTGSISQLIGIYVGDGVLPPVSKLYNRSVSDRSSTETVKWMQHVLSSTHESGYPILIWAEEGISTGSSNASQEGADEKMTIRCIRNLGMDASHELNVIPQDYIEKTVADDKTVTFSARHLNINATRDFISGELPVHYENSVTNYLPRQFEVYSTGTSGTSRTFEAYNSAITTALNSGETHPYCPAGWRLPNQREVAIMHYYMTGYDQNGNSTGENAMGNTMTRTRWSFGTNGQYPKVNNKYGFRKGGTTITVSNNAESAARCVRDIRVD